MRFQYPLRTYEVFSVYSIPIASIAHHVLLDLISACQNERDAQILALRLNGATWNDIGHAVGLSRWSVSRRLEALMEASDIEHLGIRLRTVRGEAVPTTPVPSRLRTPKHLPARNHADCWCSRGVA